MAEITVSAARNVLNEHSKTFEERSRELAKQNEKEKKAAADRKKSPYSNFYQFNRDHSKEAIWLAGNHPRAYQILLFILDQMDNYNALMCSYNVLCEALDMSRATVARAIKTLKTHNFIGIYKSGTSNVYVVNKDLAWSSWGSNYQYAKFDAKIIITESEQEEAKITTEKLKQISIEETE